MNSKLFYVEKQDTLFYPGMFNMLKGVLMLSIIFTHTCGIIPEIGSVRNVLFQFSTIPIYWMISGYGFQKTKMKQCIKTQSEQILIPYLLVTLATSIIHFLNHYLAFRYLKGSIKATLQVTAGYLIGLPATVKVRGYEIYEIGSVWFLISLWSGWIILNFLMNHLSEKMMHYIIGGIALGGIICSYLPFPLPYCLGQLPFSVFYIYLGYLIRKYELLKRKFPWYAWTVLLAVSTGVHLLGHVSFYNNNYGTGWEYYIQFLGVMGWSFFIIYIALRLNRFIFPIREEICLIGRYSLWVMCLHTVENQGILWYYFVSKLNMPPWAILLLLLGIKAVLIFLMLKFIIQINSYFSKKRKKRRRQNRQQRREVRIS